jgi:hypothetical protein
MFDTFKMHAGLGSDGLERYAGNSDLFLTSLIQSMRSDKEDETTTKFADVRALSLLMGNDIISWQQHKPRLVVAGFIVGSSSLPARDTIAMSMKTGLFSHSPELKSMFEFLLRLPAIEWLQICIFKLAPKHDCITDTNALLLNKFLSPSGSDPKTIKEIFVMMSWLCSFWCHIHGPRMKYIWNDILEPVELPLYGANPKCFLDVIARCLRQILTGLPSKSLLVPKFLEDHCKE